MSKKVMEESQLCVLHVILPLYSSKRSLMLFMRKVKAYKCS